MSAFRVVLAAVLLLCLAPGARAENPKVGIKLSQVSGSEAMAALAKATGISLETADERFDPMGRLAAQLQEKASFDWSSVRFAAALRELCTRYNVRPQRTSAGTYILYPAFGGPPAAPAKRVGLTEKNGVRLFLKRVSISSQRDLNFEDGADNQNPGSMSVYLGGELLDGDAAAIAGFRNATAKDELGNLLVSEQQFGGFHRFGGGAGAYPDEFSGNMHLPAPHPKARKLLWLEGELMVHKKVRRVSVEIPVPVPAQGAKKEAEGVTVEVTRVETQPDEGNNAGAQVSVNARASWPRELPLAPPDFGSGSIALRGASGKIYSFYSGGSGGGGGDRVTYNYNLTFSRVNEPVAAVVFTLIEKSEPEPLLSFRMTDIPLPGDPVFIPRRALPRSPVPSRSPTPEPDRPFYDKMGGRLALRVLVDGKAAPEGTLSLGFSARDGADWGPVRWTDVPVSSTGLAAFPDLKPGSYRLLRVYRMKEAPQLRTDGAWQNAEVTVEVTAGKETAAPPLIWAPRAVAPLPAVKKPAKAPPKPRRR